MTRSEKKRVYELMFLVSISISFVTVALTLISILDGYKNAFYLLIPCFLLITSTVTMYKMYKNII